MSGRGEVSKQIAMQDAAHPSPPSCPWLVLGHLPCARGRMGRRAQPAAPHRLGVREGKGVCVCVCVFVHTYTGCRLSALP